MSGSLAQSVAGVRHLQLRRCDNVTYGNQRSSSFPSSGARGITDRRGGRSPPSQSNDYERPIARHLPGSDAVHATHGPAPKPACGARTRRRWQPSFGRRACPRGRYELPLTQRSWARRRASTVHMNSLHGHLLGVRIAVHDARERSWHPPGFADCPGLKAVLFATRGARRRSA